MESGILGRGEGQLKARQAVCTEGGLAAYKGHGCTERSVFQTVRGATGKSWNWGNVGIRQRDLPCNLMLANLLIIITKM